MVKTKEQIMNEVDNALDSRNKQLFLILAREYKIACEVEVLRPQLAEMKQ